MVTGHGYECRSSAPPWRPHRPGLPIIIIINTIIIITTTTSCYYHYHYYHNHYYYCNSNNDDSNNHAYHYQYLLLFAAAVAPRRLRATMDAERGGSPAPPDPYTQPSEPILFPKLRIYLADAPHLLCFIDQRQPTLES